MLRIVVLRNVESSILQGRCHSRWSKVVVLPQLGCREILAIPGEFVVERHGDLLKVDIDKSQCSIEVRSWENVGISRSLKWEKKKQGDGYIFVVCLVADSGSEVAEY